MEQLIQNHPSVIQAILATFIFQGAYIAMGLYMFLVYLQAKKRDYLLYGIYLLLFAAYFFVRIDQVFMTGFVVTDEDVAFYFTTPLLFLITGIYIDFIDTFAEIRKHNRRFSIEVSIFSRTMYVIAVVSTGYLLITNDVGTARTYLRPVFTMVHIYATYSVIRAFVVIKSVLRYYVLASNFFLIGFTAIGLNAAADVGFREGIYSNTLWGFYSMNASQLGVFLEMICFALGLGYKFNQVELEKDKIQKLDMLKTQLYTNISHEIRTPLTLISGPIESQMARPNLLPKDQHELMLVKSNADRLLKLVNQMLDLSVLDSGQHALHISQGNMAVMLKQLVDSFRYQASIKSIHIDAKIVGLDTVWFDSDVIEKVATNLLSNAVKYALKDSTILLDARRVDGNAVLSITNTTNQAKVADLNKLFQRFYQEDEAAPGVGVGLALVKELVKLAKGRVDIQETGGHRICFSVTLPVEASVFEPHELTYIDNRIEEIVIKNNGTAPQERPTLLIVEDDEDIRVFTASIFLEKYQVLTAVDGKAGLALATETLPDVIVTDIMMPEIDGIELCKSLKSNIMTSHIPILMLTARIGEAHELEGYETGADTYLTKPFHPNILRLKIRNLLADRDRFKRHYKESFSMHPQVAVSPAESNFLATLKSVSEAHIVDPELTAEKLATLMNMSRAQLHRKLNASLGTSTTAFIRTQRINMACDLLKNGKEETVSEIAYQIGFGTVSYFNKCFKEQMNCTPHEFVQQKSR